MGHNHQHALAVLQGQIDGVLQPLFVAAVDQKLVDDQLDEVGLVAVELHAVSDVADFAVDPHLNESALAYLLEEFLVVTLAPLDQRRQDVDALAGVFFLNQLLDLLIGIAHHLFAGDIRVGFGRARIEDWITNTSLPRTPSITWQNVSPSGKCLISILLRGRPR